MVTTGHPLVASGHDERATSTHRDDQLGQLSHRLAGNQPSDAVPLSTAPDDSRPMSTAAPGGKEAPASTAPPEAAARR